MIFIIHGWPHLIRIAIKGLFVFLALYVLIMLAWAAWDVWQVLFNDDIMMKW